MITSSGAMCDVCGDYILPIGDEMVNLFGVKGIERDLHCHNKCKEIVLAAGNDWRKLPDDGPLYKAFFVKGLEVEAADELEAAVNMGNAARWYEKHKAHVDKLVSSCAGDSWTPGDEDMGRPELWKAAHWVWFFNKTIQARHD